MSRRRKRIWITALLLTVPFLLTSWHLWKKEPKQQYIPGAQVEGVTSKLERGLPPDYEVVTFRDVTQHAGIAFHHFNDTRTSQLPEDMGSGVAWLDYNNDHWQDLFVVNYALPLNQKINKEQDNLSRCVLYRNNGDGTFTDVSEEAGVALAIRGMGVAAGDYNNDGFTDLFVTTYGTNHLLKNNSDGTFSDVTHQAGMGVYPGFWAGASWSDFDRDGDLDIYITGYVKYVDFNLSEADLAAEDPTSINPSSFRPERNLFYRNNGDGTFIEMAQQARIDNVSGRSLSATWTDFNNDMWPDLYVANDVSDNILFINNQDGTFEDISHSAHVADYRGAMGIASGDWDNDLDPDLFITHWIAQENALYNNLWFDESSSQPNLSFTDDSNTYGLGQSSLDYIAWATSFVDWDLDSRLDLFVVNGSTFQYANDRVQLKPMSSQLYWNAGTERGFYDVSNLGGAYFQDEYVGRGGAYADYDRDGDPDWFIVNHNDRGILLQNRNNIGNNWLSVSLEGTKSNHSAIGAKLRLVAGNTEQIREVGSQSSYLSQNSLVQHIGMGKIPVVDTLEITWPSGHKDTYSGIQPNQLIKITEGNAAISTVNKTMNDLL